VTSASAERDLDARYRAAAEEASRLVRSLAATDLLGRMRAVVDALWTHLATAGVSWVGFYLPETAEDGSLQLVLGPSRNKPACSPIGLHGVCGQAFLAHEERIVADVLALGGDYIACDPRDRSEIVIPLLRPKPHAPATGEPRPTPQCVAVLDVDSHDVGRFTAVDGAGLRAVLRAAGLPDDRPLET
jgi:putative methionine-R-sulfoxide reductase with GAF domain